MLRNEYGTVQQHLEPPHVADIQLPLPDDKIKLAALMETVTTALEAHERSIEMALRADTQIIDLLHWETDSEEDRRDAEIARQRLDEISGFTIWKR